MREAAKLVLGHEIPVDHQVVHYPNHYYDGRGANMYNKINELLVEIEQKIQPEVGVGTDRIFVGKGGTT